MNTLEKLESSHKEAMNYIKRMQTEGEPEMKALTSFLLETDAKPSSFLPEIWESSFSTSLGVESLLNKIHSGLVDNVNISFPIINGNPRISFFCKDDIFYKEMVFSELNEYEKVGVYDKSMIPEFSKLSDFKRELMCEELMKNDFELTNCSNAFDFIEKYKKNQKAVPSGIKKNKMK
ncbi:hypothetical protein GW796_06505 [archaeon]|nr:hypothetical protein [archaeon]